jgi:hypothetical protein
MPGKRHNPRGPHTSSKAWWGGHRPRAAALPGAAVKDQHRLDRCGHVGSGGGVAAATVCASAGLELVPQQPGAELPANCPGDLDGIGGHRLPAATIAVEGDVQTESTRYALGNPVQLGQPALQRSEPGCVVGNVSSHVVDANPVRRRSYDEVDGAVRPEQRGRVGDVKTIVYAQLLLQRPNGLGGRMARAVLAGDNQCPGGSELRLSIVATVFANFFDALLEHGLRHSVDGLAT